MSTPALSDTFTAAIDAASTHVRLDGLYDALAHISDTLSAVTCQPRFDNDHAATEAFSALDDFVMDQMDAVKAKAMAMPATEWPEQEARIVLLMKHVARFRVDIEDVATVIEQISTDLSVH